MSRIPKQLATINTLEVSGMQFSNALTLISRSGLTECPFFLDHNRMCHGRVRWCTGSAAGGPWHSVPVGARTGGREHRYACRRSCGTECPGAFSARGWTAPPQHQGGLGRAQWGLCGRLCPQEGATRDTMQPHCHPPLPLCARWYGVLHRAAGSSPGRGTASPAPKPSGRASNGCTKASMR